MATPHLLRFLAAVLLAASVLGATSRPVRADIVTKGYRKVSHHVTVEYGALADHATWRYESKEGDTLASIAKAQLGAESRRTQIAALNPALPDGPLPPRTRLVMPARRPESPGPGGVGWWDLISSVGGGGPVTPPRPLYPNEPWPHTGYGQHGHVYAVPHDAAARIGLDFTALASDPAVARTEFGFTGTVRDADPTEYFVSRYRLEMTRDRALSLRLLEQTRYGKDGRVLSHATGGPAPAVGDDPPWVLLLVGAAALVALVLLARHRRALPSPASAP